MNEKSVSYSMLEGAKAMEFKMHGNHLVSEATSFSMKTEFRHL